jgi:hypothetical protein
MTERMRIADSYFERLIDHTPASEAVSAIAAMWRPRVAQIEPWFGLSFPDPTDATSCARSAAFPSERCASGAP